MKLATWNVNSLKVRLPQVIDWLAANRPDALCLQETKTADAGFPFAELEAAGYRAAHNGQKTYNGVAILHRDEATGITRDIPGFADEQKRVIALTLGDTRLVSVYVPNGQEVGSDKYAYKLAWFAALTRVARRGAGALAAPRAAGDFNVAPEDRDVHDPGAWRERILCSTPEREAFRATARAGVRGRVPAVRAAGKELFVVGLPQHGFPPQPRAAHRPHPALACARGRLPLLRHRQGAAQARAALGSRAGGGGHRASWSTRYARWSDESDLRPAQQIFFSHRGKRQCRRLPARYRHGHPDADGH
jgi:exodeoxyribonuclease-3